MPAQARDWCFTLNNYTEDDLCSLRSIDVTYMVFGREIAPETGTPHLQGYLRFKKKTRLGGAKTALGTRYHLEACKGNPQQNIDYCTKGGDYEEFGTRPIPKGDMEKQRWADARKAAEEGRMDDVPSDIYVRYVRNLEYIRDRKRAKPDHADNVTGLWIYGQAGCGKSRYARTTYPDAYIKDINKWWDGYNDEETVIIEDMDPFHKKMGRLCKIWADRYYFPAEYKGGMKLVRPKLVIFTSQYSIEDIWDDQETRDAMNRRCVIKKM